jgi:hypothetical protein
MTDEQFAVVVGLLTEIRDALVSPAEDDAEESDECQHPEDQRVSFATFADPHHWVCRVCRYEHRGIPVT